MSLSIIIPTFNEASLIERTLQSLKQRYPALFARGYLARCWGYRRFGSGHAR
jgi:Glycosyl transferase family 2